MTTKIKISIEDKTSDKEVSIVFGTVDEDGVSWDEDNPHPIISKGGVSTHVHAGQVVKVVETNREPAAYADEEESE